MPAITRGQASRGGKSSSDESQTPVKSRPKRPSQNTSLWKKFKKNVPNLDPRVLVPKLLFEPDYLWLTGLLLLVAEAFLCVFVIWKIPYTEIDWETYMIQAEAFLNGTRDYSQITGPTGPCVYPAGHLYVYSLLYAVTSGGQNIRLGQYVFALLYLLTLVVVFAIYAKQRTISPYAMILMCVGGYRIHSIFVLRLFNDPIAMLFLYTAVLLWLYDRWTLGCIFFSCGVGIKMNILLFAPGLFCLLLAREGVWRTALHLTNCAVVQLVLGAPFLLTHPWTYLKSAFNIGRIFIFKWTVNWRFIGETLFLDRRFHFALLFCHLSILVIFAAFSWLQSHGGLWKIIKSQQRVKLSADDILYTLFTSNLIGIAFARSLHYQFYSWYYHTLVYLYFAVTPFPPVMSLASMGLIEMMWNTYPSTWTSSLGLHGIHFILFLGLIYSNFKSKVPPLPRSKRS